MSDLKPTSYADMRVCRTHATPYDLVPGASGNRQGCSCHVPEDERTWEGYDLPEWLFICACCTSAAVSSGTRWSVFYCDECKDRVVAIRRSKAALAIPIGRHSMMNGIGLPGPDSKDDRKVRAFAHALQGMFGTIDAVMDWKEERLRSILADFDEDPLLVEVFAEASRRWTKEQAFEWLCHWWVTPDAVADPSTGRH